MGKVIIQGGKERNYNAYINYNVYRNYNGQIIMGKVIINGGDL
jgi:hypothetical protein